MLFNLVLFGGICLAASLGSGVLRGARAILLFILFIILLSILAARGGVSSRARWLGVVRDVRGIRGRALSDAEH